MIKVSVVKESKSCQESPSIYSVLAVTHEYFQRFPPVISPLDPAMKVSQSDTLFKSVERL